MLQDAVARYLALFPDEKDSLQLLLKQLANKEKLNDRHNFNGHITGSAIVLSPDRRKVLLVHHKWFNTWFQPGGHWEADEPNPLSAARREAPEETGIELDKYLPIDKSDPLVPLDLDTHAIPGRPHKKELDHYHHDFRYIFIAKTGNIKFQAEEVYAAAWFELNDPKTENIAKAIAKLRRFKIVP